MVYALNNSHNDRHPTNHKSAPVEEATIHDVDALNISDEVIWKKGEMGEGVK